MYTYRIILSTPCRSLTHTESINLTRDRATDKQANITTEFFRHRYLKLKLVSSSCGMFGQDDQRRRKQIKGSALQTFKTKWLVDWVTLWGVNKINRVKIEVGIQRSVLANSGVKFSVVDTTAPIGPRKQTSRTYILFGEARECPPDEDRLRYIPLLFLSQSIDVFCVPGWNRWSGKLIIFGRL